jgi:hypothetical protein
VSQPETLDGYPNEDKALLMLHSVNKKAQGLIQQLEQRYPTDEGIKLLVERYQPDRLYEGTPGADDFTYTEDKGEKIVLCLRNAKTKELHTENLVMFPLIHELAHLCDKEHDPNHGDNFKKYFKILLDEATEMGIYLKENFERNPVEYCGLPITQNP